MASTNNSMRARAMHSLGGYAADPRCAGRLLAQRLLELSLTQTEAAALSGVTAATINRWLLGQPPTAVLAAQIAAGLDTTVDAIGWKPRTVRRRRHHHGAVWEAIRQRANAGGLKIEQIQTSKDRVHVLISLPLSEVQRGSG